ncbi:MAG: tripartite tricarboxylate transporter substrate binding protein [bacterium]|nr:tripartite tricarboxylate transporter substrate binding protein [bacterium]
MKHSEREHFSPRRFVAVILMFTVACGCIFLHSAPTSEAAEGYPKKPIKVIVPFGAGGGADTLARSMTKNLQDLLGQPIVVSNAPGGGGTIGTTQGLTAKADGYTLVLAASGPLYTQPFIIDLKYSQDDYVPVAQLSYVPRVVVAHPKVPYNTLKEMMDLVQEKPEDVIIGISAIGSTDHFGMEQLKLEHGVDLNLVPQGGGAAQKTAVIGGHVDVAAVTTTEGAALVESGQVKALCLMHSEQDAAFPGLQTCEEEGYPVESGVGYYMITAADTPVDIVAALEKAISDTFSDAEYQENAKKLKLVLSFKNGPDTAEEIQKFYNLYEELAGKIGLKKK